MNAEILAVLRGEAIDLPAFFDSLPPRIQKHSQSVAQMAVQLLDWTREDSPEEELGHLTQKEVYEAVLYHDIGLTLIPLELLEKTEDLTGPEQRVIQRHATYGGQVLDQYQKKLDAHDPKRPLWKLAAETAASHHERWDGKGYPHRLLATAIPILSRITAIADAYDSIIRGSAYRMPLPPEYAVLEIVSNANKQFDPRLVELFRSHYLSLAMVTPE